MMSKTTTGDTGMTTSQAFSPTDGLDAIQHAHGSTILIQSSIGMIELTYKTRAGQREENMLLATLFEEFDEPIYSEPARNAISFFQAVLLDEQKKICGIAYEITADRAIKELYKEAAVRRMEAEFYPRLYSY
jgi:hypothetical protein